jgi:hypothetical protein
MVMRERLIVAGGNEHSAFSIQHSAKQRFGAVCSDLKDPDAAGSAAFSHDWTLQVLAEPRGACVWLSAEC